MKLSFDPRHIRLGLLIGASLSLIAAHVVVSPPTVPPEPMSPTQIRQTLLSELQAEGLDSTSVRMRWVEVDSTFRRPEFRVAVPDSFSTTKFHIQWDKTVEPLGYESPARVHFPDEVMHIHMVRVGTIHATIRLIPSS